MSENFKQIEIEMEPFKENGIITKRTELLWLQSKGVIRLGKFDEVFVRPDKGEKLSAKTYQGYLNLLDKFNYFKGKEEAGKMGAKVMLTDDNLPF